MRLRIHRRAVAGCVAIAAAALGIGGCGEAREESLADQLYSTDRASHSPLIADDDGAPDPEEGDLAGGPAVTSPPSATDNGLPDVKGLPSLPFCAYELTVEERLVLDTASELGVRECMRDQGFDWEIKIPPIETVFDPGFADRIAPFGRVPEADVESGGYDVMLGYMSVADLAGMGGGFPGGPEEQAAAMACYNANIWLPEELGEMPEEWADAQHQFQAEVLAQVRDDARVVQAMSEWSECAAELGYDGDSPEALRDRVLAERRERERQAWDDAVARGGDLTDFTPPEPDPPTSEELAAAVADADCERRTNLWLTAYEAQVDAENALIDRYLPSFEAQREWDLRSIEAASNYIASIGTQP
jgi:hypothetical protein